MDATPPADPVVLSLWRGPIRRLSAVRYAIELFAEEEAELQGVNLSAVLLFGKGKAALAARRTTMLRVLDQTKCGISELARVWGCNRRTVQKTLGADRYAFMRLAAE